MLTTRFQPFLAVILAKFTSDEAPVPIPGMHFIVGAALLILAWGFALPGLAIHKNDAALKSGRVSISD